MKRDGAHELLAVNDLCVRAGQTVLLHPVSWSLRAGEVLTLIGESGAGKSLLVQAIMGTLPAGLMAEGQIKVRGATSRAADKAARRPLWGRTLALLPQEPGTALDPLMSVERQTRELMRWVRGLPPAQARDQARQALERVGLTEAARRHPWQLSGGMAQRAALCMAGVGGAPVLMVDEPTKGLDAHWRDHVVAGLQAWQAQGGAVLIITHDLQVAQALGAQVMVLQRGEVVEAGPASTVLTHPTHAFTRALVAADPAHWPRASVASDAMASNAPMVLEARGLGKSLGGRTLFRDLDLCVRAGQRWTVQGPSGCGKSTLGNVLLGLLSPDEGQISTIPGLPSHARQKLYQNPVTSFAPRQCLRAGLREVARRHRVDVAEIERLSESLGLDPALLDRLPAQVSGGELQRLAMVRVLLVRPSLLFADEPTSRLDPLTQQHTLQCLLAAIDQWGTALLLVTHDPDLADAVALRSVRLG